MVTARDPTQMSAKRAWYLAHRDTSEYKAQKRRAAQRYRSRHPARVVAQRRRNAPHRIKENRRLRRELRAEVIQAYGGRCACCGNGYLSHLTIDHIEGPTPKSDRTSNFYRQLKRAAFPEGFQVLCWNCNCAKHFEGRCGCQDEGTP